MKELHLIVSGKVQGVFFRATVKEIAQSLCISGYAKNLNDGSVEIVAQGTEADLKLFLEKIKKNPGRSKVIQVKAVLKDLTEKLFNFRIF